MNILHINTLADQGGAAKAMLSLHQGLIAQGWNSRLLVKSSQIKNENVFLVDQAVEKLLNPWQKIFQGFSRGLNRATGLGYWAYPSSAKLIQTEIFNWADVIHLHNLHGGYFNPLVLPLFSSRKPLVWTLHDMWPFTGHCTYSYDCQKWVKGCFSCPIFKDQLKKKEYPKATILDLTKIIWKIKKDIYQKTKLQIVVPSRWLKALTEQSILADSKTPVEQISWGIDRKVFKAADKLEAKTKLGINPGKKVLLFIAHSLNQRRKGLNYLLKAIESIKDKFNLCLLLVGRGNSLEPISQEIEIKNIGYVQSQETLKTCYSAADLLVFPSLADNQPLVVIEALACGLPVIAFNLGGLDEIITQGSNGYLIDSNNSSELALKISSLFKDRELLSQLSKNALKQVKEKYSLEVMIKKYQKVYEQVLN